MEQRYVVEQNGTPARPFQVRDRKGGWVCSSHSKLSFAQARARELNLSTLYAAGSTGI